MPSVVGDRLSRTRSMQVFFITLATMSIKYSTKHITIDKSIFTEKDYKYIDPDNLSETVYRFEFPSKKPDENGDIMDNDMYIAIANMLRMQYLLPVKFLKANEDTFSYIAQKANTIGENDSIENSIIQVEPLNPNFTKQVRYVHINQMIPVGTTFYIHTEIPYRNKDDKPGPFRKLLTSASIKTEAQGLDKKILEEAKKHGIAKPTTVLFNKRIAFGALDIGSVLDMKMTVEYTDIHESMTLFRFRCPADNIVEFVVYDHFNVDMKYILNLMKRCERLELPEKNKKFLNELLDKMIAAIK